MPRTLSRGRKTAFSIILLLAVLLLFEVLAQLTFRAIYDHSYRPKKLYKLTSSSWIPGQDETGVPNHLTDLVIHPYFGFAIDVVGGARTGLGFGQWTSPLRSQQYGDKLRVLVLGGSVAVQLMQPELADGTNYFKKAVKDEFHQSGIDLDVWMFNAALPGFKQPQQFIAYSYLLTQGAEFDLVVNLDGFNEMTLAMLEGKPKGLYPAYPRGWDVMLGNRMTANKLRKIAKLLKVREEQASLIEFAQSTPLARSAVAGLVLAHKVVVNEERAQALVEAIEQEKQQGELSFEEGGIPFDYDDEGKAYRYLAGLWRRSSVLLSQLAESNNAAYLHVFQPNQYLEGSKPLSRQEYEKFYVPNDGFGPVYRAAYPYFSQQMKELTEAGEWFADASMIFKDEQQTVYSDWCCHFNEHGLRLLAKYIAGEIVTGFERLKTAKAPAG